MDQQDQQGAGIRDQQGNGSMVPAPARTTRAKGQRASKTTGARRPLKLSLPVEVIGKLQLHAIQEGLSASGLVAKLIREHCNEWVIHRSPERSR